MVALVGLYFVVGLQLPTFVSIITTTALIPAPRDLGHAPAPALVGQESRQ